MLRSDGHTTVMVWGVIALLRGKSFLLTTVYLWCLVNGKRTKAAAPTGRDRNRRGGWLWGKRGEGMAPQRGAGEELQRQTSRSRRLVCLRQQFTTCLRYSFLMFCATTSLLTHLRLFQINLFLPASPLCGRWSLMLRAQTRFCSSNNKWLPVRWRV